MGNRNFLIAALLSVATALTFPCWTLAQSPFPSALPIQVFFSPKGGCTDAVVEALRAAKVSVLIQAYGFTNKAIAWETVQAKRRGVPVRVVLDKSNQTDRYSTANFLTNMGVTVWIDSKHAIAHNKVMIIDSAVVITGSYNFTQAAEERNAENLVIIKEKTIAAQYEKNWDEHLGHSAQYAGKNPATTSTTTAPVTPTSISQAGTPTTTAPDVVPEPRIMALSKPKGSPIDEKPNIRSKGPNSPWNMIIRFGYSTDALMEQIALDGETLVWVGDPSKDTENDVASLYPREPDGGHGSIAVFVDKDGVGKAVWMGGDDLYRNYVHDSSYRNVWLGPPNKEREKFIAEQKASNAVPPEGEQQK
jgi:hypothetical protein